MKLGSRGGVLIVALLALLAAVAVYVPGSVLRGEKVLFGIDFLNLHVRRMAFAREALLGPAHVLPGWYPRELLGTPFWSNVQSFPFLPSRLAVFLAFPPELAFAPAVVLAVALTMLLTWAFARRLGMSPLAAAVSAFTFATCGFVASKVMVGHLPLLEVIPSLPLLLWLVDRVLRDDGSPRMWSRLLALALASGAVALAGHPQLVIYAFVVAGTYAWVMGPRRRALAATLSAVLGTGLVAVVLVPMAMLVGRSTRTLPLAHASNDWALPYDRLLAWFAPWRDGFPALVQHRPWRAWRHPDVTLFWDSVCYLGLLPWAALLGLALVLVLRRRWPDRQGRYWTVVGAAALVMALPCWQALTVHIPGTFLRSPARLVYVVSFVLSLGAGAALDRLTAVLRPRLGRWGLAIVGALVIAHAADVASHARAYVLARARGQAMADARETAWLASRVGDGRVGFDGGLDSPHNRRFDDVGYFDSIMLARPYRFIVDTSALPPGLNQQQMDAHEMRPRTLAATGVRLVGTMHAMADLPLLQSFPDGFRLYTVADAAPRAKLFFASQIDFLPAPAIHAWLRDQASVLDARLLLEPRFRTALSASTTTEPQARVGYHRPSPDLIAVTVESSEPGYLRVLESWDPGWQAAVDGQPTVAIPGDDVFLTAPVPAGRHLVTFAFVTPGLGAGLALSIASACLLVLLLVVVARPRRMGAGQANAGL